jgi:hypothetical protein
MRKFLIAAGAWMLAFGTVTGTLATVHVSAGTRVPQLPLT